jgi:hypothetical protein
MKPSRAYLWVFLAPALTLSALSQELPRLDGSNVPQTGSWGKPLPAATSSAPTNPAPAKPQPAVAPTTNLLGMKIPAANSPAPIPVTLVPPAKPNVETPVSTTPSPADRPAEPAKVEFHNGLLTVHASNSSLEQILRDTSTQTGMTMDGTPEDERVFGDFGPAPVAAVLGQLLDGGPSNYVVFGMNENHAPRTLVVTPRNSLAPGDAVASVPTAAPVTEDDDDDDAVPAPVANIRPLTAAPASAGNQPQSPRTPQQILDDMQKRRQERQQDQSQPASPE